MTSGTLRPVSLDLRPYSTMARASQASYVLAQLCECGGFDSEAVVRAALLRSSKGFSMIEARSAMPAIAVMLSGRGPKVRSDRSAGSCREWCAQVVVCPGAGPGDVFDQWQIDRFERSNLVRRGVEVFEQVDGSVVEHGTEDGNTELAGVLEKWRVPLPRGVSPLIEIVKRSPRPGPIRNLELGGPTLRNGVRAIYLNIDGVRTHLLRLTHDTERSTEAAIVIVPLRLATEFLQL